VSVSRSARRGPKEGAALDRGRRKEEEREGRKRKEGRGQKEKEKREIGKGKIGKGKEIGKRFRKSGECLGKLGERIFAGFFGFSGVSVIFEMAVMARRTGRRDRGVRGIPGVVADRGAGAAGDGRRPECRRNSRHAR
jgi:hypothetical protein